MSDVDYDATGPADPSNFILRDQRRVMQTAMGALEDDPEQAARSFELGKATGDDPALIYPNLENYEVQHKAMLTSQLLRSNQYLRQYVDADPMHAKLSADDFGNLDAVSGALRAFRFPERMAAGAEAVAGSIYHGAISGYRKGAIEGGGIGDWAWAQPNAQDHPLSTALQAIGWSPFEVGMRFIRGGIEGATEAAHEGAKTLAMQLGADEMGAERFARDIAAATELEVTGLSGRTHMPHVEGKVEEAPEPYKPQGPAKRLLDIVGKAQPWLEEGKEPPRGIDKDIDKLKFDQNKIDLDNLKEADAAADASATKERNPDIFAGFIRQHTDAKIGISGDAIARLYGDKVSEVGDGLFGDVPGFAQEYESAKAYGGDVHVPLADWLAKVDPEIKKELYDGVRIRPGGITKAEKQLEADAKQEIEGYKPPEPLPEPLPALRAGAGLEPLFSVGDRKLELQRQAVKATSLDDPSIPADMFHLIDENGQKRGWLRVVPFENGKKLYVDNVGGASANMFGPALTRDIARQLKIEYPDAEQVGGFRISGAREKAGTEKEVWIKFDDALGPEGWRHVEPMMEVVRGGRWVDKHGAFQAYIRPELRNREVELTNAILDEADRIIPKDVWIETVTALRRKETGGEVRGVYSQFVDNFPRIMVGLNKGDVGTLRHEAIHHLRNYGFFKPNEWMELERAARENDWFGKYNIEQRYADMPMRVKLEEAVAEGYRHWAEGQEIPEKVRPVFQKIKDFFDAVLAKFKEILGKDVTWEDVFQDVHEGKVGAREGTEPLNPKAYKEMAQETPFGMGADQFDRYMKLIQQRHAEDLAMAQRRAEREQGKRLRAEWKDNAKQVREEVDKDVKQRPDIAADLFLGNGEYLGEKLKSKVYLASDSLSPEQKAALPKHYYAKDGFPADEVANLFGYQTGDQLVAKLADLHQAKTDAKLTTRDFVDKLVDEETNRQMQARFGSLEQSILDEAKDQATSETQLNLLHEEVLALALQNKSEGKIDKAAIRSWVQDKFSNTPIGGISVDNFLRDAGKAGREAELALLKEDYATAFQAKQQQYLAMTFAKEAKDYEKARAQFDKLAWRYRKREVAGASPEYTDAVHDILQRLGEKVQRSEADVKESYGLNGHKDLADFVSKKESQLRDLHTPDWLQDPAFRKATDQLTAQEFEQVHDALKAITHNSRDELKVEKQGEKYDLEQVLGEMIEKMKSLGEPKPHPREEGAITRHVKNYWWAGINVESMLNRLDRADPKGPFYQFITHHFTEASNYKDKLIKDFQKKISAIGKIDDMDKLVENSLFKNPDTSEALILRRRNVLGILQNVGNKNNLIKLAKGYALEPNEVLDWLHQRTTKEDWDRAQKIGDVFNEIFDLANTMSHTISGVGIQRLPLAPLDTPHGTYAGWYNPVKYDPFIPGKSKRLMGPDALEDSGFYRATTPQGYTEQRTGYIAPVDLSLDIVPQRMKQMIHDVAMRPAVLQMSKFFYDNRFQRSMINYYGPHQAKEMIPFLRDIANAPNFNSWTNQLGGEALEYFRQNMIATLIGFNPGTVAKHGTTAWINSMTQVGALNYLREVKNITSQSLSGRADWKMAMEKSEELQRRNRNFVQLIEGHGSEINIRGAQSNWLSLRDIVTSVGAKPVAISDLISAVPTWLAEYKTQVGDGETEGMAVSLANRAVRQAHGSSVMSNKPSIMRNNPVAAFMTSLYGFFSHMQQKQYEMAWKARDMFAGQRDIKETTPDLIRGLFSYVIAPAIIEELVTPMSNQEHESWGLKAGKTLAIGASSSYVGIRDFVRAAMNMRDPQAGLLDPTFKTITDFGRDLSKGSQAFTKDKAGNLIKHTFALNGALTGLTNAQEGRMAEYMYNYFKGKEHPKGPWDVMTGARYGTTEKHSRSFDQWKKQTLGGR